MARSIEKLSAVAVRAAKPGMHGDGAGLWLHVSSGGARSWIFRFTSPGDGRPHEMGLGPLHTVSLAEARAQALDCRRQVLAGADPLAARLAQRQAVRLDAARTTTFAECARRYIAAHRAGWKNDKHAAQWPATLEAYIFPTFGALPVQAVDVGLVVKALEPIWTTKTETATRVRQRVEAVLDWATVRGLRRGENPARWKGCLESLLPEPAKVRRFAHHAALPFLELGAFMAELRRQPGTAARALELTILTASRTGEAIGATWPEIDFAARLWTIPAARMKARREHRVPLSGAALALLRALRQESRGEPVFPGSVGLQPTGLTRGGGRPISNMAMLMLLRRLAGQDKRWADLTVHGFRSAFRDWAAERTGFPAEVAEMALAHTIADKVEAAYRRGDLFDKRRQLMEAWARHCGAAPAAGEVVPLGRSRRRHAGAKGGG